MKENEICKKLNKKEDDGSQVLMNRRQEEEVKPGKKMELEYSVHMRMEETKYGRMSQASKAKNKK